MAWSLLRPPPTNSDIDAGAFQAPVAGSSKYDHPRSDHTISFDTVSRRTALIAAFAGAENLWFQIIIYACASTVATARTYIL